MRVWLLLLVVLATFQTIVQVASTDNISSKFITEISERLTEHKSAFAPTSKMTSTTTALVNVNNPFMDASSKSFSSTAVPFLNEISNSASVIGRNHFNNNNSVTKNNENIYNTIEGNEINTSEKHSSSSENQELERTAKSEISKIENAKDNNEVHNVRKEEVFMRMPKESEALSSSIIEHEIGEKTSPEQRHLGDSSSNPDLDDKDSIKHDQKEIIGDVLKADPTILVQIENSLLSLFDMKRPPKIDRNKIVIPDAMKQIYAQIMGHELDSVNIPKPGLLTKSANTIRSFTHQDSKIDDRFPHHYRFRLFFDVKSIPANEKLKAAELQLTRDTISHTKLNPQLAHRIRYQVLVYDITRVGVKGKREPSYLLLDNKTVRVNSTETVSLDVQPAVDRWIESPKKNFGLLVEIRTMRSLKPAPHHHVRLRRSTDETYDNWQHKQPLLLTYTDDGRHKSRSIRDVSTRSKRAGHHRRSHRRKNSEEICRRHSLYVDFADVGWSDWIVAPPGYDAFYCHGKCPFPLAEHLNSTNHAVVQTLVNNLNPGKVPKACCVPTQLEGISMLYLNDQNTVVLKNYQDMTVVGCGCR